MLKLKLERINKNLSQKQLASIIETKPQSISNWETGICTPNYVKMRKLEIFFNKPISELFTSIENIKTATDIANTGAVKKII